MSGKVKSKSQSQNQRCELGLVYFRPRAHSLFSDLTCNLTRVETDVGVKNAGYVPSKGNIVKTAKKLTVDATRHDTIASFLSCDWSVVSTLNPLQLYHGPLGSKMSTGILLF